MPSVDDLERGPQDIGSTDPWRLRGTPTDVLRPQDLPPAPPARPHGTSPFTLRAWRHGWSSLTYLVLNLPTAVLALLIVVLVIAGVAALPGALVGLLILTPTLWLARWFGGMERNRIHAFVGEVIEPPVPDPGVRPWLRLLGLTREHLQSVGYAALHTLWGTISGAITLALTAQTLVLVALPAYGAFLPDGQIWLAALPVSGTLGLTAAWAVGMVALVLLPLVARYAVQVDIQLARWLIGQDPEERMRRLSERVHTLAVSREETIDSVEAERRRIERDLHDGPQQRLVAIAMDLGMARSALERDPRAARELLDQAHSASKEAIVEMRQVARGIAPPILTDRGLPAAISALTARASLPVQTEIDPVLHQARLDPTIEAIAYFCLSEALTNVAKHARARSATIRVEHDADPRRPMLTLTVADDGVGGADASRGTGLTGLRQRVAAVDGLLTVHSPEGGPTVLTVSLPARPRRNRFP